MWFICYCKILFWTINICHKTLGHKHFFFFFDNFFKLTTYFILFFNNCSALAKKKRGLSTIKIFYIPTHNTGTRHTTVKLSHYFCSRQILTTLFSRGKLFRYYYLINIYVAYTFAYACFWERNLFFSRF